MTVARRLDAHTAACMLSAVLLLGCASSGPPRSALPAGTNAHAGPPAPVLQLPPQQLGCTLAVQQRLTVQAPEQAGQVLDALLQVDAQQLQLALFHMGQRMGTLIWDGQQVRSDVSRWWPQVLDPQQVISDVQLALWPVTAVAPALPQGWSITEEAGGRVLRYHGQPYAQVAPLQADALQITYVRAGWQLRIDSPGGMHPCGPHAFSG